MANGEFHKMHGLGNDFVIIDGRTAPLQMTATKAAAIANRRTGIGCDQLILLEASNCADVQMRIFNQDGSEVGACGNASRCVVKLLDKDASIETAGGIVSGALGDNAVTMDMGSPRFEWDQIPLADPMDTVTMPLAWEQLEQPSAVNVGNPHIIFFVENIEAVDLNRLGPVIEHDPLFPERVNVNIAQIQDRQIKLRVWERGVGETKACGTGACATAVAAINRKLATGPVLVNLQGGKLIIDWQRGDNIQMTGDATYVFSGKADWDEFG